MLHRFVGLDRELRDVLLASTVLITHPGAQFQGLHTLAGDASASAQFERP